MHFIGRRQHFHMRENPAFERFVKCVTISVIRQDTGRHTALETKLNLLCSSAALSINMPRVANVRRLAYELEDLLSESYGPAVVLPVPEEFDPNASRIIFTSIHGFSQIHINQISVQIAVNFSPDYEEDLSLRQAYMLNKTELLFSLFDRTIPAQPLFCGLTNNYRVDFPEDAKVSVIDYVSKLATGNEAPEESLDLVLRITKAINDKLYSNITYQNIREWPQTHTDGSIPRLSYSDSVSHDILIVHDLNDRLAFNEDAQYHSTFENVRTMFPIANVIEQQLRDRLGEI